MTTKVTIHPAGNLVVDVGPMVLDEERHRAHPEGLEALREVQGTVAELFDRLVLEAGLIINQFPGDPLAIKRGLDGLKGAIIQYALLFESTQEGRRVQRPLAGSAVIPGEVYESSLDDLFEPGRTPLDTRARTALKFGLRGFKRGNGEPLLGWALDLNAIVILAMRNMGIRSFSRFHWRLKDRGWLQYAASQDVSSVLGTAEMRIYWEVLGG